MGRRKPAWFYERQAKEATARENYYKNFTPPAEDTTIKDRGSQTEVFYRSMIQISGTNHLIYVTQVPATTLSKVSAAEAGLKTTLESTETALRLRGSGVKPTRIHWYQGAANPVRKSTPWGTKVARYYDTGAEQSHYSVPFSRATGVFDSNDIKTAFNALFGPGGSKRGLLGAKNGRAYLDWEHVAVSANS